MQGRLKRITIVITMALFWLCQPVAHALSISEIQLNSHLNQRLDAEILLLSATPEEIENLSIAIKRMDAAEAKLYRWPEVAVEIKRNKSGKAYLHIQSEEPVTEPVLSFLLEINWSGGFLKREYILLIDPEMG